MNLLLDNVISHSAARGGEPFAVRRVIEVEDLIALKAATLLAK